MENVSLTDAPMRNYIVDFHFRTPTPVVLSYDIRSTCKQDAQAQAELALARETRAIPSRTHVYSLA